LRKYSILPQTALVSMPPRRRLVSTSASPDY
jgi:hypothetical protein